MEKTIEFDLNPAIRDWRKNLAQSPAFRPENLDELEAHLRDSIAELETRGLSAKEAFMVATKRVGTSGSLEREFGKINASSVWLDRILWALIGIQVWGLISSSISTMTTVTLALTWPTGEAYSKWQEELALPVTVFSSFQILGILFALALCWWLIVKKGQQIGLAMRAMLARRSILMVAFVGLSLLTLVARGGLSLGTNALLIRYFNPEASTQLITYFSYSRFIVSLILAVGLIGITLLVARRRLSICER